MPSVENTDHKPAFPGLRKQMGSLAHESTALEEFWEVVISVIFKIPFVKEWTFNAWKDSVHLLHPDVQQKNAQLSAKPFEAPSYFTDEMRKEASETIAKSYQIMLQKFCTAQPQNLFPLCHSTYRDHLDSRHHARCHAALYDAITPSITDQETIHIGSREAQSPKEHTTLSSDFLSAFCPQLKTSNTIKTLHVHGFFSSVADCQKLLDALEDNQSVEHLHLNLDKKNADYIFPQLAKLNHLQTITLTNFSEKADFVIERQEWKALAETLSVQTLTLTNMPPCPIPQIFQAKLSFEEN